MLNIPGLSWLRRRPVPTLPGPVVTPKLCKAVAESLGGEGCNVAVDAMWEFHGGTEYTLRVSRCYRWSFDE